MTYEYICTACGNQWEAEQRISEAPLKACPKCGKATAKRQVSGGTGFLLKGGGWYADGYGLKPGGSTDKSTSSTTTSTTTKSEPASTSSDTTSEKASTKTSGASD